MQRIETSLAITAENLSRVSRLVESLGTATKRNQSELQDLDFVEAKKSMQQYLMSREPPEAVAEDFHLCHIHRDTAHMQRVKALKESKEFSFDAAFVISEIGSGDIWVGDFMNKLTRDDVAAAHRKKQELQDYIDDASSDHTGEPQLFRRQAAQLSFLTGHKVKLFVGGACVMRDAEAEVKKISCVKVIPHGQYQFNVFET